LLLRGTGFLLAFLAELACAFHADLDGVVVQNAVAAFGPLPYAGRAQLGGESRWLGARAAEVVGGDAADVLVGHEPGVAAERGDCRGQGLQRAGSGGNPVPLTPPGIVLLVHCGAPR
jgi:hypothetical protein